MSKERLEYLSRLVVTVLGAAAIVFLFVRFLLVPILPFLIAWAVALMLRPLAIFVSRKTHLPRSVVSVILAVLAVSIGIGGIVAIAVYAVGEAWQFFSGLSADEGLFDFLSKISDPITALFGEGEAALELETKLGDAIRSALSSLVGKLVGILTSVATSIPKVLFFILITVISAIYFSLDLDNINARIRRLLPNKAVEAIVKFKNGVFSVGAKYLRSYFILMLITFCIILTGLLILRVRNALLIGAIVAFLDLLPLIGVGTVLVPWSVYQLLFGSVGMGVGLILLLAVNVIVRQILEPRIVGKSLGIHPVISLVLLYVSYSTLGIGGIFLVPVVSVVLNAILNKNYSSEIS